MKKHNLLKSLILVSTVLFNTEMAFSYAEVEQAVTMSVQPSVAIEKKVSLESGKIDPVSGTHTGLNASFTLTTNGTDNDYHFILGSKINTIDGEVNGYGQNGSLLFGNVTSLPLVSAVENARIGGKDNANVIAYPVTVEITTPMTVQFGTNSTYGQCYVVKVNSTSAEGITGTLTQTVKQSPITGTYAIGHDEAGTYKSTVFFTAISK